MNAGLTAGALVVVVIAAVLIVAAAIRPALGPRPLPPARPPRRPPHRSRWWLPAGVLALIGPATVGAVGTLVLGASLVAVGRARRRRTVVVSRAAAELALPDAVELLVLSIHAGRSPSQAVRDLACRAPPALRPAFGAVELRLHRGHGLADALGELTAAVGPAARELVAAVATADREGLPLAPMLDRLASDARADRRRHGDAAARRLPVRLSFPLVLCTLPAFVLLAIAPAVLGALSTLGSSAP